MPPKGPEGLEGQTQMPATFINGNPDIARREIEDRERGLVSESDKIRCHIKDKPSEGTSLLETVAIAEKNPSEGRDTYIPYKGIIKRHLTDNFEGTETLDLLYRGFRDFKTPELEREIMDLESGSYGSRLRSKLAELDDLIPEILNSTNGYYKGYNLDIVETEKKKILEEIDRIPDMIDAKKADLAAIPALLEIIKEISTSS